MATTTITHDLNSQVRAEPDTVQAAVYCRISEDRNGEALGVTRQREDCLALAATRGWNVAATFTDNDASAYSGRPRPRYTALLDGIRAGTFGAVIAWHPDRLHRSPKELEAFIEVVEAHGVTVETVRAGTHDFTTANGRLMARLTGAVARAESEQKSERIIRAMDQRAAMGRPHGPARYGWRREYELDRRSFRDVVNDEQAAVVREIAARVIAGDSMKGITDDLNGRGVPAAQGGRWTRNTVRLIVLRPINVALRVHRGEVVGAGDWEPILDRGVWEQVRAVLADPARRTSTATRANHLLSGIARCGVCGEPLRAALLGHRGGTPVYRCSERSCVSRNHDQLDDFVTRLVVERLSRPDAVDLLAAERGDDAQRAAEQSAALRARLDNAADDYADGKISRRQLERVTARLNPQIAAADAAARIVDDVPLLDGIIGAPDVAAKWATLPLSRRRGVVDMLLDVRVLRSPRGRHLFDPDAIDAKWKELA